jgi:S-DNA-T family DNA segregation ATPase FtsK/SpoIIIE
MENRYDILRDAMQRNISDYNRKLEDGTLRKSDKILHKKMPYIVVIIDELADLMLTASKEIEEPIARLAQMARAVGIHLVVATQRPSVDVITGVIKANFPARIAYLVAQKVDSRTILDQGGADQLLGNGDMLFLPPGMPKPVRIQNAFISTDEVERIVEFIGNQPGYPEPYMLPSWEEEVGEQGEWDPSNRDPLFEQAARLIINTGQASVSNLQRRMSVGYARAARIMDELEAAGIVASQRGSKPREILLDSESQLEAYL